MDETPMTPEEFLASHPITRELMANGWTQTDLDSARFRKFDPEEPLSAARLIGGPQISVEMMQHGFLKAYVTLRWLVMDQPPNSRTVEEAWTYIAAFEAHPYLAAGRRFRELQREKASRPRGRLPDSRKTMREVITDLASNPENLELGAKALWPKLYAVLAEERLSPRMIDDADVPAKNAIEYDSPRLSDDGPRKTIGFGQFSNVLSKFRSEVSG